MKVLKDNLKKATYVEEVNNNYPRQLVCERCGSELEYDKNDISVGEYGCAFVRCPLCGYDNYLEDGENDVNLTMDNVEFPTHFARFSEMTGAVDCCNNENVKMYIRQAINYFRQNKNEFVWYCGTGNLLVTVYRYDGDENYWVVVSDNHYDTYIPFEEKDYNDCCDNQ